MPTTSRTSRARSGSSSSPERLRRATAVPRPQRSSAAWTLRHALRSPMSSLLAVTGHRKSCAPCLGGLLSRSSASGHGLLEAKWCSSCHLGPILRNGDWRCRGRSLGSPRTNRPVARLWLHFSRFHMQLPTAQGSWNSCRQRRAAACRSWSSGSSPKRWRSYFSSTNTPSTASSAWILRRKSQATGWQAKEMGREKGPEL